MIIAAFGILYLAVGVATQIGLVRAHRIAGWPMKEFFPEWWLRWGVSLLTVIGWPYVLFSWFYKPEIDIPDK